MQTASTRTHRLKAAAILTIVSLPIAVPLIAYACQSMSPTLTTPEPDRYKSLPGGKDKDAPVAIAGVALKLNEVHTTKDGIRVKVTEITDSRCPANAQCIWAGNAGVTLELGHKDYKPTKAKVNSNLEPREAVYAGSRITLIGLTPAPDANKEGEQEAQVVTLGISPATGEPKAADAP